MKYCSKCGSIMADEDQVCGNCGAAVNEAGSANSSAGPTAGPTPGPTAGAPAGSSTADGRGYPPKYLVQSILVLLLCCLPGGIVALVYGDKIDKLMAVGQTDEAWKASKSAKTWLIASVAVSGGLLLLYILVMVILVAVGISAKS